MCSKLTMRHHPGPNRLKQAGTSMLEILIAMLLLSFGMLAMAAMVSYVVQMPKLSGYRATAVNLASDHIDRMRANPAGFGNGGYDKPSSYDSLRGARSLGESDSCAYPTCDSSTLATMDAALTSAAVRAQLPAGGMLMSRDTDPGTSTTDGNLWIMWQEPQSRASLSAVTSDNCPTEVTKTYAGAQPRCLYVKFKL